MLNHASQLLHLTFLPHLLHPHHHLHIVYFECLYYSIRKYVNYISQLTLFMAMGDRTPECQEQQIRCGHVILACDVDYVANQ